ncbi:MAG: hypothetical protein M1826_007601 [Phylliscum demangeonii]|nr:MAG: hypothetical protein M1826_007601 [Phylliscum demangeonii]
MSEGTIQRHGNYEYRDFQGQSWHRRAGTTEWFPLETPPSDPSATAPPPTELHLIRKRQSEGEPDHWCLFLAPEGSSGSVYQVTGDAMAMGYGHAHGVNVVLSASLRDSTIIAQPNEQQADRVRYWAEREEPPSAESMKEVKENCQGWAVRVIARLVEEGIVERRWCQYARGLMELVNWRA